MPKKKTFKKKKFNKKKYVKRQYRMKRTITGFPNKMYVKLNYSFQVNHLTGTFNDRALCLNSLYDPG